MNLCKEALELLWCAGGLNTPPSFLRNCDHTEQIRSLCPTATVNAKPRQSVPTGQGFWEDPNQTKQGYLDAAVMAVRVVTSVKAVPHRRQKHRIGSVCTCSVIWLFKLKAHFVIQVLLLLLRSNHTSSSSERQHYLTNSEQLSFYVSLQGVDYSASIKFFCHVKWENVTWLTLTN